MDAGGKVMKANPKHDAPRAITAISAVSEWRTQNGIDEFSVETALIWWATKVVVEGGWQR